MDTVTTPALHCPIPEAINEHVERAEQYALEWACEMDLIGPDDVWGVAAARIGYLASYALPFASWDALKIGVAYLDWLMVYDDSRVDKRINVLDLNATEITVFHRNILEILRGRTRLPASESPVEAALYRGMLDLRESIATVCPSWRMEEFIRGFGHYLQSNLWEATNMWKSEPPRPPTYMGMRRHTGCLFPTYRLSAALSGVELTEDVWDHVALHQLETMANNYTCWINDVYSFQRELVDGHVNSLVMSLRHTYQTSFQEAVDRAADLCTLEVESYLELKSRLPALGLGETSGVGKYLRLVEAWMRALYDWHQMTGRYVVSP